MQQREVLILSIIGLAIATLVIVWHHTLTSQAIVDSVSGGSLNNASLGLPVAAPTGNLWPQLFATPNNPTYVSIGPMQSSLADPYRGNPAQVSPGVDPQPVRLRLFNG